MENDLNNGTRGGIIANPEHTSSNSDVISDNEDSGENTSLLKNKLDGSLGGTPFNENDNGQQLNYNPLDDNESNRSSEEYN